MTSVQEDIARFREEALRHGPKGEPRWRSDWPLIKHLTQVASPEVARAWRRLPLIQMPLDSVDHLQEFQDIVMRQDHDACWPFQDFVLDVWQLDYESGEKILHAWIRFSQIETYLATRRLMSPWDISINPRSMARDGLYDLLAQRAIEECSFVIESWTSLNGSFYPSQTSPQGFSIYTGRNDRKFNPCRDQCIPTPLSEFTIAFMARSGVVDTRGEDIVQKYMRETWETDIVGGVLMALSLSARPEYLVQEQPITQQDRARKPKDPKPWARPGLPRYILLEPGQVKQHSPSQGGTHASPKPHPRRGHWHTFRHPKFKRDEEGNPVQKFYKPSWIGPEEWVSEGNRYKVVLQGRRS